MATDQRSVQQNALTTAAMWQAAIQAIQASLIAAGAVITSDTGQIDATTTPAAAPAANAVIGYNVYRFSDTLQATKPVFVKLEYLASSTASVINLRVQVGTGTNGAGTLTGQVSTQTNLAAAAATSTSGTFYASCGTDYFAFAWGFSSTVFYTFVVGRMKDDAGADTGEGVATLLGWASSAASSLVQAVPFSGAVPAAAQVSVQFGGIAGMSGSFSSTTDVALGPVTVPVSGKWRYVPGCLLYAPTAIGNSLTAAFSAVAFGRSRTYLGLGGTTFSARWGVDLATALAIPWE